MIEAVLLVAAVAAGGGVVVELERRGRRADRRHGSPGDVRRAMRTATWLAVSGCAVLAAAAPAMARPRCGTVEVVDPQGRPLAGAEVAHYGYDPRETLLRGQGPETWTTNAAGRVCEEAFLESGFLEVHAPGPLGGWCVANEVVPYRGWRASAPVARVILPVKRIHRSRLHVRVVAGDGKPVAGAPIYVARIYPQGTQCSAFGPDDWLKAGRDGHFALPPLPDGNVEMNVKAEGYAERVFFVTLPSGPRELAIEAGAHWTGRVLDPDGTPIERCSITLRSQDEIEVSSACISSGAVGFDLLHLPPGPLKVRIRVTTHPTLPNRTFVDQVVIVPNERRYEDIRLPAGLTLAGQVLTTSGEPAAGAVVAAVSTDRERSSWQGMLEAQADANGRFVFHHVAAGQWRVAADNLAAKPEDWRTVSAGTADVKLVSRTRR